MNVKGLSIQDIIKMDWDTLNKLSSKEIKQVTSRLVSASNKRIRRLGKTETGRMSFAYQKIEERGRMFSVKDKNTNQVRQEFALAKQFLQYKTSTMKGWNKYRKDTEKRIGYISNGESLDWSNDTWKKYWKLFRMFEENHGGLITKKGTGGKFDSDKIQQMITELMDNDLSTDSLQVAIENKFNEIYEQDVDSDGIEIE